MSILLYNGVVLGEEDGFVLVRGNRIEKIGWGRVPEATRRVNVEGAEIVPGFCDSHTHLENIALMHGTLDLTGMSRGDILRAVGNECGKRKVIVGRGWDESPWERKEYLTREELDSVCRDSIVFLVREDGHLAVLNSRAMKEYGMGDEEGIIREEEVARFAKLVGAFSNLNLQYAQDYALSKGITCVHDFATEQTLREYFRMKLRGELKIRIYASFYMESFPTVKKLGLHSGFGDSHLRVGALKIFADGSIGAKTAATRYVDGMVVKPMLDRKRIRAVVKDANSSGIRVFTHAIGDLAIEEVLASYEGTNGNRVEHFELARVEQIHGGMEVSMQPNFLKWAKRGGLYHRMLGEEWLENNNAYRKIVDSGTRLLFGSDCMPMDPLFGIKMATESEYPGQRITYEEALKAYTIGAKYMHPELGEIRAGAIADLVVINNRRVEITMVDGTVAYSRKNLNGK